MTRYVAFSRAINVGRRRISSDDLRQLFIDLDVEDVDTYLASGNIVFSSDEAASALETRVENAFDERYEWDVPTFLRTIDEVQDLASAEVFDDLSDSAKTYVVFARSDVDGLEVELDALSNRVDRFTGRGREIWWLRDMDGGESMTTGEVEKELGLVCTRRTLRTIQRLLAKFG